MKTLLKMFFIPRVKTFCLQFFIVLLLFYGSLYFQNFNIMALALLGFFVVSAMNLLTMNFSDNIDWLRNSVYSSKKLLSYYFLEQFLIFSVAFFLYTVFLFGPFLFLYKFIAPKIATGIEGSSAANLISALPSFALGAENYFYASPSETALEIIFALIGFFSFVFAAELIKKYMINMRYQKRFSKEAVVVQLFIFSYLFFMMSADRVDILRQFKIILTPLGIGLGLFGIIFVFNNAFKLFRPSKKSIQFVIPVASFIVLFTSSLSFSFLSFKKSENYNVKLTEHQFLGIFAPKLSQNFTESAYTHDLSDATLSYLMEKYPMKASSPLFYEVTSSKKINQKIKLLSMWKLQDLPFEKRSYVLNLINDDFLSLKDEKIKEKVIKKFISASSNYFKEEQDFNSLEIVSYVNQKNDLNKRDVASESFLDNE